MCGITGFIEIRERSKALDMLKNMSKAIGYRGPDSSGHWYDYNTGVGLAHRRLSILDLTETGAQPMISKSGQYVIVFNGEIYNHNIIRSEIEESSNSLIEWEGTSDTETLLAAIEVWGLNFTLNKLTGMFAFALWDKKVNELFLIRDRLGEKPLFYGWMNGVFLFSSELKALKVHNAFLGEIDRKSLVLYLKYLSVPAPYSIFKDIFKVEPGCIVRIKLDGSVIKSNYWDICDKILKGKKLISSNNSKDNGEELHNLMSEVIRDQMIADVPVGAFLSGGIDSSFVTALMQEQSSSKVNTYSISFEDKRYDESKYAADVANHLGTDHHSMFVTSKSLLNVVPNLPKIYDEPFADSSQIPSYLVSKYAAESVKVVLTGDGADELFGGYNRYLLLNDYWKRLSALPFQFRKIISNLLDYVSEDNINSFSNIVRHLNLTPDIEMFGSKVKKAGTIINSKNDFELYEKLVSIENNAERILLHEESHESLKENYSRLPNFNNDVVGKIMALDQMIYLPTDILTKVDRASMANSLEGRIPFLDHRVVEFSWSIPFESKICNGVGKKIIRNILIKYFPENFFERPKKGFGVPLDKWLRTDLKDWAESLLNEERLKKDGYFNVKEVRNIWMQHINLKHNHANRLWSILMFQAWLDNEV
jgi:asparagine synthase (glutamine-hydrolysing)